jgi:peptidoglycan-associated lipoprotein
MSRFNRSGLLVLTLSALIVAGCTHKPKNITPVSSLAPAKVEAPPTDYNPNGGPIRNTPPINQNPNPITPGRTFGPGNGAGGVDNPNNPNNGLNNPQDPTKGSGSGDNNQTPLNQGHDQFGGTEDRETLRADTVYFDYDKSAIKSSEGAKVGAVADYLKGHPEANLVVEGHCDERGTEEYNRALGERRALAIREQLINKGVSADKVTTVSYGKDRPVESGHSEDAWSKNRRGEFVLVGPAATLK